MLLQVGVKAFIRNNQGKYLMLKRAVAFGEDTKPKWDIPGGRISPGEELFIALAREIKEETGMILTGKPKILIAQDIIRPPKMHVVRLTFAATARGKVHLNPEEHTEFGWFSLQEIKKLYHDSLFDDVFPLINPLIKK